MLSSCVNGLFGSLLLVMGDYRIDKDVKVIYFHLGLVLVVDFLWVFPMASFLLFVLLVDFFLDDFRLGAV